MVSGLALAAILAKFALYLGVLTAAGTALVSVVFRLENTRDLTFGFSVVGLVAALFGFLVQAANLTGDLSGIYDAEMLRLLWSTPVGAALSWRVAGLCLLIAGTVLGRIGTWISVLGGAAAIFSFHFIGHVSAQKSVFLDIAVTLHLLTAAFWIGILTPLWRLAMQEDAHVQTAELGHKFGVLASITVPVLILMGGYMSYHLLGSRTALMGTGYGQGLLFKVLFVAGLLGLAAFNKVRLVPALRSGERAAAGRLARSIKLEWLVVFAVLAMSAIVTTNLTLPA